MHFSNSEAFSRLDMGKKYTSKYKEKSSFFNNKLSLPYVELP